MKRALIALGIIVLVTLHSSSTFAGQADNLKGIDRVRVVCRMDERVRSLGITADMISTSVETQLRKGGLKIGESSGDLPMVAVDIAMPYNGIFSDILVVELSVNDRVTLERNGQHTWAPVWTSFRIGGIAKSFAERDINAILAKAEDALLNDVSKVN